MYTWTIIEPVTRPMFSTVKETASLNSSPVTTASDSYRLLRVNLNLPYDKPWLQQIENHVRRIELET